MFGGSNFKKTIIKNKICMVNQIKYWIKFQIKCLESDEVFDLFILSPNLISSDFELFYISQFSWILLDYLFTFRSWNGAWLLS